MGPKGSDADLAMSLHEANLAAHQPNPSTSGDQRRQTSGGCVADHFNIVPVWVEYERTVVVGMVLRP